MTPKIKRIQKKMIPLLKRAGVIKSALFGSIVRGDDRPESDIDVLVEFPKGKSLMDLVDLNDKLEQELDRKIDLTTFKSVSPLLKTHIEKHLYPIL